MTKLSTQDIIDLLQLIPHPEGGYYREMHRSKEMIKKSALPRRYTDDRCFYTHIYHFLPKGTVSRLHRLKSDEIWHFHLGGPLALIQILPDGKSKETVLGQNLKEGQKLFELVPAGTWFGAIPYPECDYALIGATVAPGFEFADFQMGKREELLKAFPDARQQILKLTT